MDRSTLRHFDPTLADDAPARADIYGGVHKALRAFMFDTLARLGRCDAADRHDLDDALAQAHTLVALMRAHLQHEDTVLHPAMEARAPGSASHTADDHLEHVAALDAMSATLDALAACDTGRRGAALYRAYLQLAQMVGDNLLHMQVEETHNTQVLRATHDDAEIGALIGRIIASIPPAESALWHRWMFVAMNHDERLGLLQAIRAGAPAEVFDAEVARARDVLGPRDWGRLANALGVPAGAGLIEAW